MAAADIISAHEKSHIQNIVNKFLKYPWTQRVLFAIFRIYVIMRQGKQGGAKKAPENGKHDRSLKKEIRIL